MSTQYGQGYRRIRSVTECYRVQRFAAKRRLDKALQSLGNVWLLVETLASDSLGAGGRRFESYRPDQIKLSQLRGIPSAPEL